MGLCHTYVLLCFVYSFSACPFPEFTHDELNAAALTMKIVTVLSLICSTIIIFQQFFVLSFSKITACFRKSTGGPLSHGKSAGGQGALGVLRPRSSRWNWMVWSGLLTRASELSCLCEV